MNSVRHGRALAVGVTVSEPPRALLRIAGLLGTTDVLGLPATGPARR